MSKQTHGRTGAVTDSRLGGPLKLLIVVTTSDRDLIPLPPVVERWSGWSLGGFFVQGPLIGSPEYGEPF